MPKTPRRPPSRSRKTDAAPTNRVVGRSVVAKPADPCQAGLFDTAVPHWIQPCLPTLVERPPTGPLWIHEIKWDGYRVSAYIEGGGVTIRTRNGHDWTPRFPAIAAGLTRLRVRSAVLDGEAVVLDEQGRSVFAELQADLTRRGSPRAVLYAFDLLFLDGEDLRALPLEDRRLRLGAITGFGEAVLFSEEYVGVGADMFAIACGHGLEGIVSKRLDKPYRSGRRIEWLKTKCVQSGEFVIVGYQPTSGAVRGALANIKVATDNGGTLRFAGAVGTGFGETVARALRERLDRIVVSKCVIAGLKGKGAVWVAPDLRVEIAHRGLTTAGELRHASFKGLIE